MNIVIELPRDDIAELPYREAFTMSMPQSEGDHLLVIEPPEHWWGRTRVTDWVPDWVDTPYGSYLFPRLTGVGASHSRRRACASLALSGP